MVPEFTPRAITGALKRAIGEEEVAHDGARQRYRVMERLELLWRTCEPHLDPPRDEDGVPLYKADPRFVEAGIRILDRIARIYRLDSPGAGGTPAVTGAKVEIRELVSRAVADLEARITRDGSQDQGTG